MLYKTNYNSPIGDMTLLCDDNYIKGLYFNNQNYYLNPYENEEIIEKETSLSKETFLWLDDYFNKKKPDICSLPIQPNGTSFQKTVWDILLKIPYSQTTTYKDIAKELQLITKIENLPFQAVGNAVAHNHISIIIPCHRVIGSNNKLTGYAGGIKKKKTLLELEDIDTSKYK